MPYGIKQYFPLQDIIDILEGASHTEGKQNMSIYTDSIDHTAD